MSNLNFNASILHQLTQTSITGNMTETLGGDVVVKKTIALTTAATQLTFSEITSLGAVAIKAEQDPDNLAEDDILISVDGGSNYTLRITEGGMQPIRLNSDDKVETQTITTVADVSDSLDGTYVTLEGNSGTWAIWIDTDDSGTAEPSHGLDDSVEVTGIATDDTAAAVAAAIYAALIADTDFMADFDVSYDAATDDDFITITDKHTGTRTDIADTGSTGFTLATTQQGAADTSIYIKSAGTSIATIMATER